MEKFKTLFERYILFPSTFLSNNFSFQLYMKRHLISKLRFSWILKMILLAFLFLINIAYVAQTKVNVLDLTSLILIIISLVALNIFFYLLYFHKLDFEAAITTKKFIFYSLFLLGNLILWFFLHILGEKYFNTNFLVSLLLVYIIMGMIFVFDFFFLLSPYFIIKYFSSKKFNYKDIMFDLSYVENLNDEFWNISYDSDFWEKDENLNPEISFHCLATNLNFHFLERELIYFYVFKYKDKFISVEVKLYEKNILNKELKEFLTEQIIKIIK